LSGAEGGFVALGIPKPGPILAKKLVLGDRTEALVYILAHEFRHMHQQHGYAVHSSFPVGRVKNARGRYSEVCTEAYAINRLRAWRQAVLNLVHSSRNVSQRSTYRSEWQPYAVENTQNAHNPLAFPSRQRVPSSSPMAST
jgi:hypothetical protein